MPKPLASTSPKGTFSHDLATHAQCVILKNTAYSRCCLEAPTWKTKLCQNMGTWTEFLEIMTFESWWEFFVREKGTSNQFNDRPLHHIISSSKGIFHLYNPLGYFFELVGSFCLPWLPTSLNLRLAIYIGTWTAIERWHEPWEKNSPFPKCFTYWLG